EFRGKEGEMKKEVFNHISHITGTVNGISFTGEGGGTYERTSFISDVRIQFINFPATYTPVLCRSWSCKRHKLSVPVDGEDNFLLQLGGNIRLDETILYISGASGEVRTTGVVRMPAENTLESFGDFRGVYQGPTDVIGILEHRESFVPLDPGILHITGYRKAEVRGGFVEAVWYGLLEATLPSGVPWEPYPFTLTYEWLTWDWNPAGQVYQKNLRVTAQKGEQARVRTARAEDMSPTMSLYTEITQAYLDRQGYRPEEIPWMDTDTLKRILESERGLWLVSEVDGKFAGFALATICQQPDDLLKGPYGDIAQIFVSREFSGLGIESILYQRIKEWFLSRSIFQVRSTSYAGDRCSEVLFDSFGFRVVAQRLHRKLQ
ncbi:MAG: N-acetyltransferase family protein, partial [bacterium JZ-2024 1]